MAASGAIWLWNASGARGLMKLVTVDEMVAIEKDADLAGLSYAAMMENAGHGLAMVVLGMQDDLSERSVVGLVGPGNNGGDTLVALAEMAASGWMTNAYLVRRAEDHLTDRLRKAGGRLVDGAEDSDRSKLIGMLRSSAIWMDGLLGTGAKPPLRGEVLPVLETANSLLSQPVRSRYVVAVDCPSGID